MYITQCFFEKSPVNHTVIPFGTVPSLELLHNAAHISMTSDSNVTAPGRTWGWTVD